MFYMRIYRRMSSGYSIFLNERAIVCRQTEMQCSAS